MEQTGAIGVIAGRSIRRVRSVSVMPAIMCQPTQTIRPAHTTQHIQHLYRQIYRNYKKAVLQLQK